MTLYRTYTIAVLVCLAAFTAMAVELQPGMSHGKRSDDLGSVQALLAVQAQKLSALEAELQAAKNTIASNQHNIAAVQAKLGSTFVRWGRSSCPSESTLLYSGVAGGSLNTQSGNGANRLCLTKEPVFDNTTLDTYSGQLDGAKYYIPGHHYTDVVCAVCHSPRSVTYMVPGTNRCPPGSSEQYHGYLTAGDHNNLQAQASEYLCLDAYPEDLMGSQDDIASGYFEHVRSHCGSLPCPPYVDNKVVTCVVCSV
ncbi:uncharacterized protein [Littorina saxatilis]|uniref:Short-chain collagen C4-like n=1 Tax=Littorina saxatilis TaxID=31220 RepID=A0AAN9B1L9_9CAEN